MPNVDNARIVGNEGASFVATILSRRCLVRPVSSDTDVGIDLYCETLDRGRPFVHFWVQVKSGAQCKVRQDGRVACSFGTDHLAYWQRQPVPVFAALVPNGQQTATRSFYVVDITGEWIDHGLPPGRTKTLKSTAKIQVNDEDALDQLVSGWAPLATARLRSATLGIISEIPQYVSQYIRAVPAYSFKRNGKRVIRQLQQTAALSVAAMWREHMNSPNELELLQKLADISRIIDNEHWESHFAQALALHLAQRFDDAAQKYNDTRRSILGDKRFRKGNYARPLLVAIRAQRQQALRGLVPLPLGR